MSKRFLFWANVFVAITLCAENFFLASIGKFDPTGYLLAVLAIGLAAHYARLPE